MLALNKNQLRWLVMNCKGMTRREIAESTGLSLGYINTQFHEIYTKLGYRFSSSDDREKRKITIKNALDTYLALYPSHRQVVDSMEKKTLDT